MEKITKEQLIQISKVGFPERVKQFINFDNCEIFHWSGVYRLYDKEEGFDYMLPKKEHLSIFIGEDNFIQIKCGDKAFNNYAAIKEMINLGIIL